MRGEKGNILGKNLRELRQARGLKQGDVADALGVPSPTYSSWERGRTEPNIEWLLRLARYFGVSLDRLLRSEFRALRVGSCYPLRQGARFHPIEYRTGIYTLIYHLVFNRLFFFDIFERRFHIELIDSWRLDRNRPSYTFYLRSDVNFHDGTALQLEDVEYSYRLFLDKYTFYNQFIEDVKAIEEEYAIELRLKQNKWLELDHLPSPCIISSSCRGEQCFAGTGPFKLTEEQQNALTQGWKQPVILESNNAYFAGAPSIKVIELYKFDGDDELENSLKRGELDVADDFALDQSDKFNVEYGFGVVSFYLVLKQDSDEDLRKAIDFALDRRRIIDTIGIAELLPRQHLHLIFREPLSPDDGNSYDPANARRCWEKAKASLGERGIADLTLRIASSYDDTATLKAIDGIISQLGEVGINAQRERDLDRADALVRTIPFHRPETVYLSLHSSKEVPWEYRNTYMDHLLDNIEGMNTYREIQKILTAERLFIPLFRRKVATTYTKDLDTKSKLQVTNPLYGPDILHWEFK
jgi:ABC-type transport system substrate-binding protein